VKTIGRLTDNRGDILTEKLAVAGVTEQLAALDVSQRSIERTTTSRTQDVCIFERKRTNG